MPYIDKLGRTGYAKIIENTINAIKANKTLEGDIKIGDVNYIISSIIWNLFQDDKSYGRANELMGVLECVKQEFYRRQVVAYEEEKIKQNGDLNVIRGTTERGDNYEIKHDSRDI